MGSDWDGDSASRGAKGPRLVAFGNGGFTAGFGCCTPVRLDARLPRVQQEEHPDIAVLVDVDVDVDNNVGCFLVLYCPSIHTVPHGSQEAMLDK